MFVKYSDDFSYFLLSHRVNSHFPLSFMPGGKWGSCIQLSGFQSEMRGFK